MGVAAIMFLLLIILILLGMPVAFSLGIVGAGWILFEDRSALLIASRVFSGMNLFVLLSVPFFIMSGEIMNQSGVTERLIKFVNFIVGRVRGGLAQANIYTSILFAGLTGAAISDATALGSVFIPSMEKEGYSRNFSAMITAASAIIGPIIPPSIMMVIYSAVTGISVGALFAAGIVPGVLLGLGMSTLTYFYSIKRNHPKYEERFTPRQFILTLKDAILALLTPVIIIGGILGGFFTPTEAAAVAAFYALFLGVIVYRKVKLKDIASIMRNAIRVSAMLLFIMGVANILGWIIARAQVPEMLIPLLMGISENPNVIMFIVLLLLIFVGTWLEPAVSIAILIPLLAPIMTNLGFHPLHFATVTIVTLCVGLITPPLGTVVYGVVAVGNVKYENVIKEIWPYLAVDFVIILLLAYIPQLTLYMPRLFGFIQ